MLDLRYAKNRNHETNLHLPVALDNRGLLLGRKEHHRQTRLYLFVRIRWKTVAIIFRRKVALMFHHSLNGVLKCRLINETTRWSVNEGIEISSRSWSDVTSHQSSITRLTLLGVAKARTLKLDFGVRQRDSLYFSTIIIFKALQLVRSCK